jgi:small-conductance mechanosensitive channel
MADSLQKLVPGVPAALIGLLKLAGGLTGFAVLVTAPGLLVGMAADPEKSGTEKVSVKYLRDRADAIFKTGLKTAAVTIWSFLPLEIYFALLAKSRTTPSSWLTAFLLLLSLVYFPMALKMLAGSGKLMPSLLVSQVLEKMVLFSQPYFRALPIFWLLMILPLPGLLLWRIPFAGPVMASFLILYLWFCAMYLLGASFDIKKEIPEKSDEDR